MTNDKIMQTIRNEIRQAQQPLLERIDQLERDLMREIDATDEWANGLFVILTMVLPHLLRGHPEVEKIQTLLQTCAERYEELQAHPERAVENKRVDSNEAVHMLYRQLALLGVWPDIDPAEEALNVLGRDASRRMR